MAATGHSREECAKAIGVSAPTMQRYYFSALESFERAALMTRGAVLQQLAAQAAAGNVAAMKELGKAIDRAAMPGGRSATKQQKPAPAGKKEKALEAARAVGADGGGDWGFLRRLN